MANRHNITFNTEAEYNTFKASSGYVEPNVSYTLDDGVVHYNPDLYRGHDYVDLGLPSGTKWATMNVGASSITDYGNYYKYGLGASQYDNAQADYSGTENPLAASADTAVQVWGGSWHMPTEAQLNELTANTTYTFETNFNGSGINGGKFTAQNGNYIFIPAGGHYTSNGSLNNEGTRSEVWASTPSDKTDGYYMMLQNGLSLVHRTQRLFGKSIRPVVG